MSETENKNPETNAISDESLDKVAGGIQCPPKRGTGRCHTSPYDRGHIQVCDAPDHKNVGKEYTASDGVRYVNRICLNCGAQWAAYYACDGKWYTTANDTF